MTTTHLIMINSPCSLVDLLSYNMTLVDIFTDWVGNLTLGQLDGNASLWQEADILGNATMDANATVLADVAAYNVSIVDIFNELVESGNITAAGGDNVTLSP